MIFENFFIYLGSLIFSFIVVFFLLPIFIRYSQFGGFMDLPDGVIKIHKKAISYLGGLGVFIGFLVSFFVFGCLDNFFFYFLFFLLSLFFVGFIDDAKVLSPAKKFFLQFLAIGFFLKYGITAYHQFFKNSFNFYLSFFWIISIVNAFNLIDVMDGLSSLVGILITCSLLILAFFLQMKAVILFLLALLGALIAFFLYNCPPARIYIGDSGAMFIGGALAVVSIILHVEQSSFFWLSNFAIFAIPLLELFFLILIRSSIGIPFYKGSPHHFSIYLMNKGFSKKSILFFVLLFGFLFPLLGLLFSLKNLSVFYFIFGSFLLFLLWTFFIFFKKNQSCKEQKRPNLA